MNARGLLATFADLANGHRARELLAPALNEGDAAVTGVEVLHAWHKTRAGGFDPARAYLDVCYRITLASGERVVLHGRARGRGGFDAEPAARGEWPRSIAVGQHADLRLHRFPDDPLMPELAALIDPRGACVEPPPAVRAALGGVTPPRPDVVAYRPGQRCTLRLSGDGASVFAKVYAGGNAARVAARLHALAAAAVAADVPQVLHCDVERSVLWLRGAPGLPLAGHLGGAGQQRAVAAAARTLACLHGSALPGDLAEPLPRTQLWHEATRKVAKLRTAALATSDAAARALSRCAERLPLLPAARPVTAHGDAHAMQFLVDDDTAVLLDLDELCRADAELDLSRLLVDIELAPLPPAVRSSAADTLLASYDETAPRRADPALLSWYCDLQRIDRAYRDYWRHGAATPQPTLPPAPARAGAGGMR